MTHRNLRSLALALAATAVLAAPAMGQDLRSPDAADPVPAPAVANLDLRSPDAADPYVRVAAVASPPAVVVRETDTGFDWADAGVGAGALLVLLLLALAGSAAARRHHHPALG